MIEIHEFSKNQIFLSVIWTDSLVCSTGPKQILSVQINSNMIFTLTNCSMYIVVLHNCFEKKVQNIQRFENSVSTSISLTISLILPSFSLLICYISDYIDSGTSTHLIREYIVNLNKLGFFCHYIGK